MTQSSASNSKGPPARNGVCIELPLPDGKVSVLLKSDLAPHTCAYFSNLITSGGLEDCQVFRILTDGNATQDDSCPIRIVQFGPRNAMGAPRHAVPHEDTRTTTLRHRKWTVSAARFSLGELYGSFFVCMRDEPELDWGGNRQADKQGFAAFGQVVDGFDVLESVFESAGTNQMLTRQIPVVGIGLRASDNPESRSGL